MTELYIDLELAAIASAVAAADFPSIQNGDVAQIRALLASLSPKREVEMASVIDRQIAEVPVREYQASDAARGTIILFHGGGWVLGGIDDYDQFACSLALLTDCRIVSVGYRLAPEHRFPAAVDDAWAVVSGINADGPLFVLGDSAGGNLSAVVAQMARDRGDVDLAGQILIYPSVAGEADSDAMRAFDPPIMPRADIAAYYDLYIPDVEKRRDVRFAPLRGHLDRLAPALVIAAGADLLASEAREYAAALTAAGVPTTLYEQHGALHAYLTIFPLTTASRETMKQIGSFIENAIENKTTVTSRGKSA